MLEDIGQDIWIQRHPLGMLGCQMGRVVTLVRLRSGQVVIHSTANFGSADIAEIRELGEPGWLFEATRFHDTCAVQGRAAFPDIPYLVPQGFKARSVANLTPIETTPAEWRDEIELIQLAGMPSIRESALFHRPSKTLVVADLMFNLPPETSRWTQLFLRATGGISKYPGMSRLFRFMVKDRQAFQESMAEIAALDFETIVVAHGDPITSDAKEKLLALLDQHRLDPASVR